MGVYGSAPTPPDPQETAAAQTGTNVSTAIANSYLGNINQVTPDGSLNYSKTGQQFINDPNGQQYWMNADGKYTTKNMSGKDGYSAVTGYYVPQFTATQTLSPQQQAIKAQEDKANLNFATLANTQSNKLNKLLADPFSIKGAPNAGSASSIKMPQYSQFSSGPQLQTSIGDTGQITGDIASAGDITRSYGTDYGANVQQVQDALLARMQPSLDQNRAALEQRLANQGLQPGSEAFNRAIDTATRQENDARYGAILNAGQEQNRLASLENQRATFENAAQQQAYAQNANNAAFSNDAQAQRYQQALQNAQFGNTANQQMYQNQNTAIAGNNALSDQRFNAQRGLFDAQNQQRANYLNEQYAQRNQRLNEVLSLASGAQVQSPNFVPTQGQNIPTVDYAGLVNSGYQNQMAKYNSDQAGYGAILGGIGSLFSLSDRNAKKDVEEVGELKGHKLYEYRYKGEKGGRKHLGVMAQEVEKKRPDAVMMGDDGLRRVNYGKLFAAKGKK